MDISDIRNELDPILENVPNYYDNTPSSPLFEAKVGNAELLFCGFNLDEDYIECRQLRRSIMNYVDSDRFKPKAIDKFRA